MGLAYYNEHDEVAAAVLRRLIAEEVIAFGDVDTRSITDVRPGDLSGYAQCHFFAGGGLWSVAARMAGWPDDRPLWTGSCPCQPFSAAGKGGGVDDPRHLWPDFFRLIRACRPPVVMGEQVAGAPGYGWFDGVRADLAGEDYASRVVDIPACAVDAPHIRQRLYWVACDVADNAHVGRARLGQGGTGVRPWERKAGGHDSDGVVGDAVSPRLEGQPWHGDGGGGRPGAAGSVAPADGSGLDVADADEPRSSALGRDAGEISGVPAAQRRAEDDAALPGREHGAAVGDMADAEPGGSTIVEPRPDSIGREAREWPAGQHIGRDGRNGGFWSDAEWLACHDGKARRTKPGLRLLVDGMPGRVGLWRIAGNAIVAPLAAEVIRAFMDVEP